LEHEAIEGVLDTTIGVAVDEEEADVDGEDEDDGEEQSGSDIYFPGVLLDERAVGFP
jgi:hypothetical protein